MKLQDLKSKTPELYNLLICGAHFIGIDFVRMGPVAEALGKLTTSGRLTYFGYVTAKFCLLVDAAQEAVREDLNLTVKAGLLQRPQAVRREALSFIF